MAFSETKHINLSFYRSSQPQNTPGEAATPSAMQTGCIRGKGLSHTSLEKAIKKPKELLNIQVDITNSLTDNIANVKPNLSEC